MSQSVNSLMSIRLAYVLNNSTRDLSFSSKYPDNCALVTVDNMSVPILINSVMHEGSVVRVSGTLLRFERDLYTSPYPSRVLGIEEFCKGSDECFDIDPTNKCILFPNHNSFIVIPFATNEIL